ncbi:MAG: hypothetical protein ABW056_01520 [Thermoanaerobaculia bacterium]
MFRRILWLAVLLNATLFCFFVARRVPAEDGGLVPAGLLLLVLGALLLRRSGLPRSDRTA